MRNYVIINGVNSLTIQGLAIKTLPPITKPIQRNLREEIDGRDGDIVTTLGYGAYDKTIEIGLFGTFDIDEVIAYFNQKGTITFSNEADKVYYFEALDQVDYAELLKFRTANVVLHCQPFKYPLNETPLEEEYEYVEGEGTELTLNDTANAIFNKFDLKGNTSQASTPTPSSPIPVNVVSGDNTIDICGKNLFDFEYISGTTSGVTTTIEGTNLKVTGTATGTSRNITGELPPFEAGTYTFSVDHSIPIRLIFRTYDDNGTKNSFALGLSVNSVKVTFDGTETKYRLIANPVSGTTYNVDVNLQLEKGSTATTYEPYIGKSYPINLGDIELCKIGTYQDYIYKDNGSWYLHKEIGKVVLNGTQNITLASSGTRRFNATYTTLGISNVKEGTSAEDTTLNYRMNDHFIYSAGGNTWGRYYLYNNWLVILDSGSVMADANALKTWLESNNTTIYYVLATPTNTLIEDTTLIEQLEALKLATSYATQTNISQENNDLPFELNAIALEENSDHLVIDNIGNIYSKPTLDLEGTGIVDIYLNDTQMFEVDLSEKNEIVIDTEKMEAYNPTDNTLANRQVTGDYSKFKLDSGENDLRFSGALTKATITNYERWL